MELVVAMVVLVILLPTAVPLYDRYLGDAKEESLKQRLTEVRRAIASFRIENGRYPNWLFDAYGNNVDFLDNQKSELVQGVHNGPNTYPAKRRLYLAEIPIDPVTENRDWELIIVPNENAAAQQSAGAFRTTTGLSRRTGWQKGADGKWTAPPVVVNPFIPAPSPVSGVGDIRSRAPGYQDL